MQLSYFTKWFFLFSFIISIGKGWALDTPYAQKLKNRLAESAQKSLSVFQIVSTPTIKYAPFPTYFSEDVASYLSVNMPEFEVKMHPLVLEYISFWTSQPEQILRAWMGVNNFYMPEIERQISTTPLPKNIQFLAFSMASTLPTVELDKDRAGPWGMYAAPFIALGGKIENGIDERYDVGKSAHYAAIYLHQLYLQYNDWTLATTAFICGASALNKALLAANNSHDYWDLYSFLPETSRDFYPAMLACAFVLDNPKWKMQAYSFSLKEKIETIVIQDTVYKEQLISFLNLDATIFEWQNATHISSVFYPNQTLSYSASAQINDSTLRKASAWEKERYFPQKNDSCYVFYHTKKGDYFRDLTNWFGVSLEQIKELNHLASNTLPKRDDVFFRVAKSDSALYASFDKMSREEKDLASGHEPIKTEAVQPQKQTTPSSHTKVASYTIQSGDTLWKIAQKYHVTDTQIMEWNGIGPNIQPGQKIKIYLD